jgi:hypothetical protein
MPRGQSKIWSSNDIKPWRLKERGKQARPYNTEPHQGTERMTATQAISRKPATEKKNKDDTYVQVKADPPEVRGEIGDKKSKGVIPTLLERLGPDAQDYSREAPPELAAARIWISDLIEHCDPNMPFAHNVEIDYWRGIAIGERIRGQDLENRKLTDAQVETVMADILRPGAWKPNGDTIRFTHNGQVIDGQGRIIALLLACRRNPKASFVTDLRFNVPPEAFPTIDTGKKRTSKDVLDMAHVSNGYLMSAVARLWNGYHIGRMKTSPKITNAQVFQIVKENEALFTEATRMTAHAIKEARIPGSVLGFCCALALRTNPQKAKLFFGQLSTGLNLGETDAAYVLIRAVKNKVRLNPRKGADRTEAAALTIKAMNAHFRGESIDVVRWGRNEAFPRFVGDSKRELRDTSGLMDADEMVSEMVSEMEDA